jgi:transposase
VETLYEIHLLCNAHHIRELISVHEEGNQPWAQQMIGLLIEGKEAVQAAKHKGKKALGRGQIVSYQQRYEDIIAFGMKANPPPLSGAKPKRGRVKRTKARNFLDRFSTLGPETLRYLNDFNVPFDNNLVERDIRMMKVQQKISGTFRSHEDAGTFCRIRSFISTM